MNRLFQMIVSQVLRHVVKRGVQSGISRLSSRNTAVPGAAPSAQVGTDLARKARQAVNLARRLGR